MARVREYFVFQNNATGSTNGEELIVEKELSNIAVLDSDVIVIDISGTATSGTTQFEIKVTPDTDYRAIAGVRNSDFKLATSTSGINEAWIFDIGAFYSFRCRLIDVTGGYITIKSKVSKNN